jgi:hypothetical protein
MKDSVHWIRINHSKMGVQRTDNSKTSYRKAEAGVYGLILVGDKITWIIDPLLRFFELIAMRVPSLTTSSRKVNDLRQRDEIIGRQLQR